MKQIALGVLTMFFLYAAYLQFNDPYPVIWVSIYGLAALFTLLTSIQKTHEFVKKCIMLYGVVAFVTGCKFCFLGMIFSKH
jgi:hypothetical protein